MKAVIQRVTRASVEVNGQVVGRIDAGLLVLLGVAKGDGETDGRYLVEKIRTLRIFADDQGKMNRSLFLGYARVNHHGVFLVLGHTKNVAYRANFSRYEYCTGRWNAGVETGVFAAHM